MLVTQLKYTWDFLGDSIGIGILAVAYWYSDPLPTSAITIASLLAAAAITHAIIGVLLRNSDTPLQARIAPLLRCSVTLKHPREKIYLEKKEIWVYTGTLLVRIIFLPLMLAAGSIYYTDLLSLSKKTFFTQEDIFLYAVTLLLFFDVAVFAFAYLFESTLFKNVVTSVDTNPLSWLVTLACYPPLIYLLGNIFGGAGGILAETQNQLISLGANSLILACLLWYVWATVSLGMRAGNLSNKGIVSSGAYASVRHPAYTAKVLGLWIASMPLFTIVTCIALINITIIYFLRAQTEEMHLSHDPQYLEYKKQVPYRFIPQLW